MRTRETVELAPRSRSVPLLVEPDFDEIKRGAFDGAPIREYRAWREQRPSSARCPGGESLDAAVRRYADGLQWLLAREKEVALIAAHEHAIRHIVEAAGSVATAARGNADANTVPYFFDGTPCAAPR